MFPTWDIATFLPSDVRLQLTETVILELVEALTFIQKRHPPNHSQTSRQKKAES